MSSGTTTAARATTARGALPLMLGAGAIALAVALTILTGGAFSARTGYDQAVRDVVLDDWWTLWAIPPVEVALTGLLVAWLLITGRREGRAYALAAGAVLLLAICSPVAGLAQSGLLSAHMGQHVLIGAVAPLLALMALPQAVPGETRRRWWTPLLSPPIAFGLWVLSTVTWLVPAIHHHVLISQPLWIVQQVAFFTFGAIFWAPVTERLAAAPRWYTTGVKCGVMIGLWFVGLTIANVFWFAGHAFYASHAAAAQALGMSPLEDQGIAGTVMMVTHCFIAFGAVAVLFFRAARERTVQQRLVEAGIDAERARWAVRYGGAEELAQEAGIPIKVRAGID